MTRNDAMESGDWHLANKLPLWIYFPAGLVLMWSGLAAISEFAGPDALNDPKIAIIQTAPIWLLGAAAVGVPLLEALVWTAGFTEGFDYTLHAPILGAVCGVVAYSFVFHWSGGALAIVSSAWIGSVLNVAYCLMRKRSRLAALANAVALRWCFFLFAYVQIHSLH